MLSAPGNPDPQDPRYAWTRPWDLARPKTPLHHQGRPLGPPQPALDGSSLMQVAVSAKLAAGRGRKSPAELCIFHVVCIPAHIWLQHGHML